MKKYLGRLSATALALVLSHAAIAAAPITETSIAPMLQQVMPAVVNIKAQIKITDFNTLRELQKRRQNGKDSENVEQALPSSFTSVGSGVIIDAKSGFIVTNAHVVADAQNIMVTLSDGRHFRARLVGVDKPSDVALIQIKAKNLTNVTMSDSNLLKVGDFVAAIGNPFGLSQTVTSGIVSALGRNALGIENYENFIQTDAPINPGNSGGALINMKGQLVGINTAILAPDRGNIGIGFSIPANMAKSVIQQLIQYGNVKRGVLGIGAEDVSPELAIAFHNDQIKGAAITQVLPYSPAQQAGIKVGDIVTAVNGSPVKSSADVVNTIGFLRVDTKVTVNLMRQNKPLTVNVTLSDPKVRKQMIEKMDPFLYGVGLKDFDMLNPIHGNVKGILITSVEEDSLAWQSDLRTGDVITSINQEEVKNIDELKKAIKNGDKTLLIHVLRGANALFLVMNTEN